MWKIDRYVIIDRYVKNNQMQSKWFVIQTEQVKARGKNPRALGSGPSAQLSWARCSSFPWAGKFSLSFHYYFESIDKASLLGLSF